MQPGARVETHESYAVVIVDGEVDMASAPTLRPLLKRTVDDGWSVLIVDLTDSTLIDSAGLGVLLGGLRRARAAGGTVELVVPDDHIRRVFRECDLDRVFTLHETREAAAQRLSATADGTP